jgi:arylsulfatase A-like enzyme
MLKKSVPFQKYLTLLVLLFLLSFYSSCSQNEEKKQNKPNIILFFVDDLGWSDLGFRNPVFETPNIDALAKSGISFNQAYIASPTCSPSRATLLTGKHPARLQMVRHIPGGKKNGFDKFDRTEVEFNYLERDPAQFPSRNWLPLEHTTYAEALSSLGYYNLFIGKWHLGHEKFHPTEQGFHKQIGTSNDGHPKSYYPPYFKQKDIFKDDKGTYLTDKLTNNAVDFITNYDKENPFLLTFSYYSVHTPHQGREDLVKHFKNKGLEDRYANYAAMVKATDESVGKVLKAVKEKGIEKETIIIFLSDQGGFFENAPFRGGKMKETLFEGGSRVPFFVYHPEVTKPNSINNSVVQSTDLYPTLVEIAGGDVSEYKNLDGVSLFSTIKNNDYLKREPIYGYRAYEDLYVSVRQDDWKLLAYRSGKIELFNITEDIKETTDVSTSNPEKVNELVKKLIVWEKEMKVEKYSGIK